MEMQQYVELNGITVERTGRHEGWRTEGGWQHFAMEVRLKNSNNSRSVTLMWRQGSAHGTETPDVTDVFNSLILDASSAEDCDTLEVFADEFGYDITTHADRRQTQRIFAACQKAHTNAIRFLGSEEEFHWIRENVNPL